MEIELIKNTTPDDTILEQRTELKANTGPLVRFLVWCGVPSPRAARRTLGVVLFSPHHLDCFCFLLPLLRGPSRSTHRSEPFSSL